MNDVARGPVGASERVLELDVLRGVALFGVLLVNIVLFARNDMMATSDQLLALPTAAIDGAVHAVLAWLVEGKAYTLFAFLFGLGFCLQMQRQELRGVDFDRVYLRRLTVLLLFGIAHNLFIWAWDILHLYALAGLVLFALRHRSDRALLYGGVALAFLAYPAYEALIEFTTFAEWHERPSPFTDAAVLARQAASESGSYMLLFRAMLPIGVTDYLLSGLIFAFFAWSLGRFLIGAWVGRRGWFQDAARYLPGFRRAMRIALPSGLVISGLGQILVVHADNAWLPDWEHWRFAGNIVRQLAMPVLALGYASAIVCGLHAPRARRWLAPFADAGRMALSNYVAQSFIIGFVLFGFGPGLALAGKAGTTTVTAIAIAAFAIQVVFSRWWMARFRFGPLEWLWRAATYGRWSDLRLP
ncbi:MAG: DUF418 domain-containing protein [Gammaproteobacteria bacterium]